jgi:signal transduction histidine kinase
MRERIEALDGRFEWNSDATGTRLTALIPWTDQGQQALGSVEMV